MGKQADERSTGQQVLELQQRDGRGEDVNMDDGPPESVRRAEMRHPAGDHAAPVIELALAREQQLPIGPDSERADRSMDYPVANRSTSVHGQIVEAMLDDLAELGERGSIDLRGVADDRDRHPAASERRGELEQVAHRPFA